MSRSAKQIAINAAKLATAKATARLQGMKLRAMLDPPKEAPRGFPYPARTCAEWKEVNGVFVDRQMTRAETRKDAIEGSASLRDAILEIAA